MEGRDGGADGGRKQGNGKEIASAEFKPIQTPFEKSTELQILTWYLNHTSSLTFPYSPSKWYLYLHFKFHLLAFVLSLQSITTMHSCLIASLVFSKSEMAFQLFV